MTVLNVEIVSPRGLLFRGECHMAVIPGSEGEVGVMFDHQSLITSLRQGKISLYNDKEIVIQEFEVTENGGVAGIYSNNTLSVLLD